jgi:hypothetical protein
MFGIVRFGGGAFCVPPFALGTFSESFGFGSAAGGLAGFPIPLRAGSTGPCSGIVVLL